MTTRDVREVWTHYHRGRTVGCSKPNCPGCKASCPMRYEAYVGLYVPATKFHCILGLTVGAVRQIVDQIGRLDSIRGLMIQAKRASKRLNARVVVLTQAICPDMSALPPPFEVLEHLERIWGMESLEDIKAAAEAATPLFDDVVLEVPKVKFSPLDERWTLAELPPETDLEGQMRIPGSE